jgi:transposase
MYASTEGGNPLVASLLSSLKSRAMLVADRGFDANWIGALVREHGAGRTFRASETGRSQFASIANLYRARNLVERFFNKIKPCRRVARRHAKLAAT